jgi:hypothetical protein
MLSAQDMALRVGHEGKNTPGGITNTGNVVHRAVGIMGIASLIITPFIDIAQDDIQPRQRFGILQAKTTQA